MATQYRSLVGRAGFDLSCQDIRALKLLDPEQLLQKVKANTTLLIVSLEFLGSTLAIA